EHEAPGGDVGEELVPFDLLLRDPGPPGPDLGVDAAHERQQQEADAGGGEHPAGEVTARRAGEEPAGVEAQPGQQKDERKLNQLRVEIPEELPEVHGAPGAARRDVAQPIVVIVPSATIGARRIRFAGARRLPGRSRSRNRHLTDGDTLVWGERPPPALDSARSAAREPAPGAADAAFVRQVR